MGSKAGCAHQFLIWLSWSQTLLPPPPPTTRSMAPVARSPGQPVNELVSSQRQALSQAFT